MLQVSPQSRFSKLTSATTTQSLSTSYATTAERAARAGRPRKEVQVIVDRVAVVALASARRRSRARDSAELGRRTPTSRGCARACASRRRYRTRRRETAGRAGRRARPATRAASRLLGRAERDIDRDDIVAGDREALGDRPLPQPTSSTRPSRGCDDRFDLGRCRIGIAKPRATLREIVVGLGDFPIGEVKRAFLEVEVEVLAVDHAREHAVQRPPLAHDRREPIIEQAADRRGHTPIEEALGHSRGEGSTTLDAIGPSACDRARR